MADEPEDKKEKKVPVGTAKERGEARPVNAAKSRTIGQVVERDEALPVSALKGRQPIPNILHDVADLMLRAQSDHARILAKGIMVLQMLVLERTEGKSVDPQNLDEAWSGLVDLFKAHADAISAERIREDGEIWLTRRAGLMSSCSQQTGCGVQATA